MRLIYLMGLVWLASFITLLIPFGCPWLQTMIALALIGLLPFMIFIGVLRLRPDP